jgi:putative transposase
MDIPVYPPAPVFYRRNLPHWHPRATPICLTWRLFGSLPMQPRTARNGCATQESPGRRFRRLDALLDRSTAGPHWLQDRPITELFLDSLGHGSHVLRYFTLHAFVVMPNHVHLLITPRLALSRITNV